MERLYIQKARAEKRLNSLRKETEKYNYEHEMVNAKLTKRMHDCLAEIDWINEKIKEGNSK